MSKVVYGADGRFYGVSQHGVEVVAVEVKTAGSSLSASAEMLTVDDMAAAVPHMAV